MDQTKKNQLIIEDRKKITLTSIVSVDTFNAETISLTSALGRLIIQGHELKITAFSKNTGLFNAEGRIDAVRYAQAKAGLFKRFFR